MNSLLIQSVKALQVRVEELTQCKTDDPQSLLLPSILEWVGRVSKLLDNAQAADVPEIFIDSLPYMRVRLGRIEDSIRSYCEPLPGSVVMELLTTPFRLDFKAMFDQSLLVDASQLCDEICELLSGRGDPDGITVTEIVKSFRTLGNEPLGDDRIRELLVEFNVSHDGRKTCRKYNFREVCLALKSGGGKQLHFRPGLFYKSE